MLQRIVKFLCLVSLLVALVGVIVCFDTIAAWLRDPTLPTISSPPSSSATVPTTVPETTAPEPTQPTTQPEIPESEPLPPTTPPAQQAATSQKPFRPHVAVSGLSARNYFVYDTRLGEFLYINGAENEAVYPASTTKLFTTYVALQHLSPEQTVTVGSELSYVVWDASVVGFMKGDRVSVETLAYCALLPSGCDASYILAAAAGKVILHDQNATAKNAIAAFMDECNRLAKELGMENTNLVTPDGYHHEEHRICMQGLAIIGKLCLENTLIAKIVSAPTATVSYTGQGGKSCTLQLKNTNHTIQTASEHYNALSVGLKTGFTDDAGYCLLTAYEVNDRYILVGIFGCESSAARFQEANKLIDAYLPYL